MADFFSYIRYICCLPGSASLRAGPISWQRRSQRAARRPVLPDLLQCCGCRCQRLMDYRYGQVLLCSKQQSNWRLLPRVKSAPIMGVRLFGVLHSHLVLAP